MANPMRPPKPTPSPLKLVLKGGCQQTDRDRGKLKQNAHEYQMEILYVKQIETSALPSSRRNGPDLPRWLFLYYSSHPTVRIPFQKPR